MGRPCRQRGIARGGRRVEFDHCLFASPFACSWGNPFFFRNPNPADPPGRVAISVRATLFEASGPLVIRLANATKISAWEGEQNAYRLGGVSWIDDRETREVVRGLDDWRSRPWVKEQGSIEADTIFHEAPYWRLLPGTPGQGVGPDGTDLGADVDRVARPAESSDSGTAWRGTAAPRAAAARRSSQRRWTPRDRSLAGLSG